MELDVYLRFVVALILVLALIGALTWATRRFGIAGRLATGGGKHRRLAIVEAMALDARRKLVLVRRDDREHLVLLGPGCDVVVEVGIAVPPAQPSGQLPTRAGSGDL